MLCVSYITVFSQILINNAFANLMYMQNGGDREVQASCIVEEFDRHKALGWVYPLEQFHLDNFEESKIKYLPSIQNDYNCKFSPDENCSELWRLENWNFEHNRSLLEDIRWEDLPTIILTNKGDKMDERTYTILADQRNGLSIRSTGPVMVLLCSKETTQNRFCYQFNISKKEINVFKFYTWKDNITDSKDTSIKYRTFRSILLESTWRHFEIGFESSGKILLLDKNINRVIVEHADDLLKSYTELNLIIRSNQTSAWKISENRFLLTKTTQVSPMGPRVEIPFRDLCISLFVASCRHCEMIFYYMDVTNRTILSYDRTTQESWTEIMLTQKDVSSSLSLFVETKFVNHTYVTDGWWAIDDVRVCHNNEVKFGHLKLTPIGNRNGKIDNDLYCKFMGTETSRLTKIDVDEAKSFPHIDIITKDRSINLSWNKGDSDSLTTYMLTYQGIDDGSSNRTCSKRRRSAGFLTSRYSEFIITDLIPKTKYNITISTLSYEIDQQFLIETLDSDSPLIKNIEIYAMDSHTVYFRYDLNPTGIPTGIKIKIHTGNSSADCRSVVTKIQKCSFWEKYCIRVDNLEKYKEYTFLLSVKAENSDSFEDEVYESAYTSEKGYKTADVVLTLSFFWQNSNSLLLCLRISKPDRTNQPLISYFEQERDNGVSLHDVAALNISMGKANKILKKNEKYNLGFTEKKPYLYEVYTIYCSNNNFGLYVSSRDIEEEIVPASPENVSHKIMQCETNEDYSKLKITWDYPYFPNGTISKFNISLQNLDVISDEPVYIMSNVSVDALFPSYSVEVSNITYGAKYKLFLQSVNTIYKSNLFTMEIQTENIKKYIHKKPRLLHNNESMGFHLPMLGWKIDSYQFTVVIQNFYSSTSRRDDKMLKEIGINKLCNNSDIMWTSTYENVDSQAIFMVEKELNEIEYKSRPNIQYCITYLIKSKYCGKMYDAVYYENVLKSVPNMSLVTEPVNKSKCKSVVFSLYFINIFILLITYIIYYI